MTKARFAALALLAVSASGALWASEEQCAKYGLKLFTDRSSQAVERVVETCKPLAEAGNAEAQYHYAASFMATPGGAGHSNMLEWMLRAATNGHAGAQYYMGTLYKRKGEKEAQMAVEWLESASRSGLAPAPIELADMYRKGVGVPINGENAVRWYEFAVREHNMTPAREALIEIYSEGMPGIAPDMEKAEYWRNFAAEEGCDSAG